MEGGWGLRSSAPCMGRQQQQQWTERKKKRDMERVDERAREGGMVKKKKRKKGSRQRDGFRDRDKTGGEQRCVCDDNDKGNLNFINISHLRGKMEVKEHIYIRLKPTQVHGTNRK